MKPNRVSVTDEAVKNQIIFKMQLISNDVNDILYKVSNGPSFREAFETTLLQNADELITFLDNQPKTMIAETGVLDDIYSNPLVLDKVDIDLQLLQYFQQKSVKKPYQMIIPIQLNNQYFKFNHPSNLGQILRYSPQYLTKQIKFSIIADAINVIQQFHGNEKHFGCDFNVDNCFINQRSDSLLIHFPQQSTHKQPRYQNVTHLWLQNKITNFQYVQYLNILSGRRLSVFHAQFYPWVFNFKDNQPRDPKRSQYHINKGVEQTQFMFINQKQTVSLQLKQTLNQFLNLQATPLDITTVEPHHVGGAGVTDLTLFCYIARRSPLSLLRRFVRPRFVAKQYCDTLPTIYQWSPEECCIEFYTDDRVLTTDINQQQYSMNEDYQHIFGNDNVLQNVKNHQGMNPKQFIKWHLKELNDYQKLNQWVDIIFGPQHSGIKALSSENQPMGQVIQPLGMLNETYNMYDQPHPAKYYNENTSNNNNKFFSIVTKDGYINAESIVQHQSQQIDNLNQTILLNQIKQQSKFSILCQFLPEFTNKMFNENKFYSLDRIYLCQLIYQVFYCKWAVKTECFLDCLDEKLCYDQEIALQLVDNYNNSFDILQLIVSILSKCKTNQSITAAEISKYKIIDKFYEVSDLKQQINDVLFKNQQNKCDLSKNDFDINKIYDLDLLQQIFNLQKFVNTDIGLKILDQYILLTLLHLNDASISKLTKNVTIQQVFERTFDFLKQRNNYEHIINIINTDQAFDAFEQPTNQQQSEQQSFLYNVDKQIINDTNVVKELIFCPICYSQQSVQIQHINNVKQSQSHKIVNVSSQIISLYETFIVRRALTNTIIYNNYLSYNTMKQLYNKCLSSISLFMMLNKVKMNTNLAINNFYPIGMKLIAEQMYNCQQLDDNFIEQLKDMINDLTYFLLQLNDMQMTGNILEYVLVCLLSVQDNYCNYFYKYSYLAQTSFKMINLSDQTYYDQCDQQMNNHLTSICKIEKISQILCQQILSSIITVMQQSQCNLLLEKVLFVMFEQRYHFLYNYLQLLNFNLREQKDMNLYTRQCDEIKIIAQPLLQVITVMAQVIPCCSKKHLDKFFQAIEHYNIQFCSQFRLASKLLEVDSISNLQQQTQIELENSFPLVSLLLLPGINKTYIYQIILLIINTLGKEFSTQNRPVVYEKVILSCLVSCPKPVVREMERIAQVRLVTLFDAMCQKLGFSHTYQPNQEEEFHSINFQEVFQDIEHNSEILAQNHYFQQLLHFVEGDGNYFYKNDTDVRTNNINYQKFENDTPLFVERVDWLSNQIDFNLIASQLLAKLQKNYKLIQENDNLFKDVHSQSSKFNIFEPYIKASNIQISQYKYIQTIDELMGVLANPLINDNDEQHHENSMYEPSITENYTRTTQSNYNQMGFNNNESRASFSENLNAQIYEVFNVINSNTVGKQSLNLNTNLSKLDQSNYLVTNNGNMQIINSYLIGHQQKSPLVLDTRYQFSDNILAGCGGLGGQIYISTQNGQVMLFDINKNKVCRVLQEQRAQSMLYQSFSSQHSYLQQGYSEFLQNYSQQQVYPTCLNFSAKSNILVAASSHQVTLFDDRQKQAVISSMSTLLQNQNLKQQYNVHQLKQNNNYIFIGSDQFVDYIDMRSFRSECIFSNSLQTQMITQFTALGCSILQQDTCMNMFYPNLSETPFTNQLLKTTKIVNLQGQARCSCVNTSQNIYSIFSYQASTNEIVKNDIGLKHLFAASQQARRQGIQINQQQSIYGIQSLQQIQNQYNGLCQCKFDETLGVYFLLFNSGQLAIVK